MEERKTAAIVLSVLLLIVIIILYFHNSSKQTLSLNSCIVHISYVKGLEADSYRAAKNKLALCLCNVYQHKPDTAIRNMILTTYQFYGTHNGHDSVIYINNIDSVIRNKSAVFDTLIYND